jgi:hypothetical protein
VSVSVSVNGGDFRFAVPPNPGTVRIHVGFTDCGESSGTAGTAGTAGNATSQPPVLLSSIMFGLPELVMPENPADFDRLGVTFCSVFKQSGTATASASVHYIMTQKRFET